MDLQRGIALWPQHRPFCCAQQSYKKRAWGSATAKGISLVLVQTSTSSIAFGPTIVGAFLFPRVDLAPPGDGQGARELRVAELNEKPELSSLKPEFLKQPELLRGRRRVPLNAFGWLSHLTDQSSNCLPRQVRK
jgi:hypothetical protein